MHLTDERQLVNEKKNYFHLFKLKKPKIKCMSKNVDNSKVMLSDNVYKAYITLELTFSSSQSV